MTPSKTCCKDCNHLSRSARLNHFEMYTNNPSGLIELLLFYPVSILSAIMALIAWSLVDDFKRTSMGCAIGSVVLSLISGILFIKLFDVFQTGQDKLWCLSFVIPFCISVIVCWFNNRQLRS